MSQPFFYNDNIDPETASAILNEETSKHIVQVLRMTSGERINLTNGKGYLFKAEITDANKKRVTVSISEKNFTDYPEKKLTIAISPVKNNSRFEWFLEKATEIGVYKIIPLICKRTEKQHFRIERWQTILISAMLQSQQTWLPILGDPEKFTNVIAKNVSGKPALIAHCEDDNAKQLLQTHLQGLSPIILIGPEGDFTKEEIQEAMTHNYIPVSLGNTRLRTETAGIVAVTLINS